MVNHLEEEVLLLPSELQLSVICECCHLDFNEVYENNRHSIAISTVDADGTIWVESIKFLNWWARQKNPNRKATAEEIELLQKSFGNFKCEQLKAVKDDSLKSLAPDGFVLNFKGVYFLNWEWSSQLSIES